MRWLRDFAFVILGELLVLVPLAPLAAVLLCIRHHESGKTDAVRAARASVTQPPEASPRRFDVPRSTRHPTVRFR